MRDEGVVMVRTGRGAMVLVAMGLVLVLASCSSSDVATETGDDTDPNDTAPASDPGDDAEGELTDSFRGVTSDAIQLGVTAIDFEGLNEQYSLSLTTQSFVPMYEALVADVNERGGVVGREVELTVEEYLPADAVGADAACLALTEDAGVFAILGGFAGPGSQEVNQCIVDTHETVLVGTLPSAEEAAAAAGLWVTPGMNLDRRNIATVDALDQQGLLAELGPMLVVGSSPEEQPQVDTMVDALADAGVDALGVVNDSAGDANATEQLVGIFAERADTEGIETAVLLGTDVTRNSAFFTARPQWTFIIPDGDLISSWQASPPDGLEATTRVITTTDGPEFPVTDEDLIGCVEIVEAATGLEVTPTSQLGEDEPNYWLGMINACREVALFEQVATAAGPDLGNGSWVEALDDLPDVTVPGYAFASLNGAKFDARDSLVLAEYDVAALTFEPISEPLDVG